MTFETSQQLYFIAPGQALVARWLETFKEFPPRQKPASFNVDAIVQKLSDPQVGGR